MLLSYSQLREVMMNNQNFVRNINDEEIKIFTEMLYKLSRKSTTKDIQRLRCAIYARKSSKDETATSLDAQISYCRELIKQNSLLEEQYVFQEDNVSGMWSNKRDEFLKMFELVKERKIDVIVCMAWDRFARKSADLETYREIAYQNHVYILTGDNTIIVKDSASKFAQTIMLASNEYFARQAAEKTFNCLLNLAKNGEYVCGKAPFGYQKNSINSLDIDFNEAIVVNKIFTLVKSRKNVCINSE